MRKRISISMRVLAFVSIAASVVMLIIIYRSMINEQVRNDVRSLSRVIESGIRNGYVQQYDYLKGLDFAPSDRVTLIDCEGRIIYDSRRNNRDIGNHFSRPEIHDAIKNGYGEAMRLSGTFGNQTYYYAVRLENGNILRTSKEIRSLYEISQGGKFFIPIGILLVILICEIFAERLTKKILKPLNNINLDEESPFIYDEMSPFMRVIDRQRKELEAQILAKDNRLDTINAVMSGMQEGIIVLDKSRVILSANKSGIELLGGGKRRYEGKSILELIRTVEFIDGIRCAFDGERSDMAMDIEGKTLQVVFSPVLQEGRLNGAIILILDITEKAMAEVIRKEFTANVSHELKTPLTTVLGLSELISGGIVKQEDVAGFGLKIKNEVNRLISLIENIIKLSQLDEGVGHGKAEIFDAAALAMTVADSLKPAADEKGVSTHVSPQSFFVNANTVLMEELLFNLMDNGIKYNRVGGQIWVEFIKEDCQTVIRVRDTGIGIGAEHLPRVFERFYRVDKSRSKKTGGTGLGLSIVKHIALYHGGNVEAESKEGEGTVITVIFR